MQEIVEMSIKELNRLKILTLVQQKKLTQVLAAQQLNISERQVRNLLRKIEAHGDKAIVSQKRGKAGNHSLPLTLITKSIALVKEHYLDFGPKLANEYLKNEHGINISNETLRLWMIKERIWLPKVERKKLHLMRERRGSFGELIQVDGSHHDWFEGRRAPCVLMVMIDDATSTITSLYFAESESLYAYYQVFAKHLKTYGIPMALYGDRCSTLTPRSPKTSKDTTQFQLALKELNCKLILALSPQAKGRVERANRTLQNRLIKMLRLRKISTIEEANRMLEEYRLEHNKLFSKRTSEQLNAHRSLEGICLDHVLCMRKTRALSKDFVVQFDNNFYKIFSQDPSMHFYKGGKVEIRKLLNGSQIAFFKGKIVKMIRLSEVAVPVLDAKEVLTWKDKKKYIPPHGHPFKHPYVMEKKREEMWANVV